VVQRQISRTVTAGQQVVIYVMFSVITATFLFLTDIGTDQPFKANLIFYLMLLGSFFFLVIISFTTIYARKLGGEHSARFFFFTDTPLIKFIIWVPIGLFGAFAIALVSQNLGLDRTNASLISIGGSGLIMMIIFFITKSVLIPMVIHGFFNTLVIALREGILFSFTTTNDLVPIPNVGITTPQINQFLTDTIIQFSLVSTGEEMLKILVIAFVVLGIPNAKFKDGIAKYIGGFFALLIWTSFHTITGL